MTDEREEMTASKKLGAFIDKNKKVFISVFVIAVCVLIGFIVYSSLANKAVVKNLQALDEITYTLTSGSSALEESEIELRRQNAIEQAGAYTSKGGIVGARANMLCADLTYQQKKYEDSAAYWKACAAKAKKSYLAPIANFNLAVCEEELNKMDDAAEHYKLAADNLEFILRPHAMFSYARVVETQGNYELAAAAYNELIDAYADNEWAKLAKSRLIVLKNMGKIE